MEQIALETRPLYGIGTVARLTGLKPDTLRVWERRYGLGASRKSKSGRRQYTQADLEHLQLVAALIDSGSRIGEIAASDRKTLEVLCRQQAGPAALPPAKARVGFIGEGICDWIEDHQGCLANIDATLVRQPFGALEPEALDVCQAQDVLVLESNGTAPQLEKLAWLTEKLKSGEVVVCSRLQNESWLRELEKREITALDFPPEPARLVFEVARCVAERTAACGNTDLGELVSVKPREFTISQLSAAKSMRSALECECPGHITGLIEALAEFEQYSSRCSVEDWQDAAAHACIYTYTSQARWLMERALKTVMEHHAGQESYRQVS